MTKAGREHRLFLWVNEMSDSTVVVVIGKKPTIAVIEAAGIWDHRFKYADIVERTEMLEIFDYLFDGEIGVYRAELTELEDGSFEVNQSYFLKTI